MYQKTKSRKLTKKNFRYTPILLYLELKIIHKGKEGKADIFLGVSYRSFLESKWKS